MIGDFLSWKGSFSHLRFKFAVLCLICIKKYKFIRIVVIWRKTKNFARKGKKENWFYERNLPFDMEYLIVVLLIRNEIFKQKVSLKGGGSWKGSFSFFLDLLKICQLEDLERFFLNVLILENFFFRESGAWNCFHNRRI